MSFSQTDLILDHLRNKGPLTPLEALNLYGCFRLGARIWDLEQTGLVINTQIIKDGKKHYARYSLEVPPIDLKIESNGQYSLV